LFEAQVAVAVVAAPVLLTRFRAEALLAPFALFQFGSATTPATAAEAIGVSPPTKSMLIGFAEEPPLDVTTKLTFAVTVPPVLVPLMVSVKLPVGVLEVVATVSVELFPALTDVGLNVPVAPVGRPLTLRLTVPLKPPTAVVLTV
jgi:hypothetical protein